MVLNMVSSTQVSTACEPTALVVCLLHPAFSAHPRPAARIPAAGSLGAMIRESNRLAPLPLPTYYTRQLNQGGPGQRPGCPRFLPRRFGAAPRPASQDRPAKPCVRQDVRFSEARGQECCTAPEALPATRPTEARAVSLDQ